MVIPAIKKVDYYAPQPSVATTSVGKVPSLTGRYVVKKGDSLWSIANMYNIRVDVLARGNGMRLNDILSLGRVLKVPAKRLG